MSDQLFLVVITIQAAVNVYLVTALIGTRKELITTRKQFMQYMAVTHH